MQEQRKRLTLLLQRSTLKEGKFEPAFKMPFEGLRRSNSESALRNNGLVAKEVKIEVWLPIVDAFRTLAA